MACYEYIRTVGAFIPFLSYRADQKGTNFSRRIEMRKILSSTLICLSAEVVLLAAGKVQPLNVKTGLWQVSTTTTMSGLPDIPPEMQARLDQMTPEQRAKMEAMMKSRFGGTPQTS